MEETMETPEAILAAAKSGGITTTWRVLRPKGSYPVGAGCMGAFVMLFLLFFASVLAFIVLILRSVSEVRNVSAGGFNPSSPGTFFSSFFSSFLPVSLPMLITRGVAAIVVVGLLSAMRAITRIPYSYFGFTPEGPAP